MHSMTQKGLPCLCSSFNIREELLFDNKQTNKKSIKQCYNQILLKFLFLFLRFRDLGRQGMNFGLAKVDILYNKKVMRKIEPG